MDIMQKVFSLALLVILNPLAYADERPCQTFMLTIQNYSSKPLTFTNIEPDPDISYTFIPASRVIISGGEGKILAKVTAPQGAVSLTADVSDGENKSVLSVNNPDRSKSDEHSLSFSGDGYEANLTNAEHYQNAGPTCLLLKSATITVKDSN